MLVCIVGYGSMGQKYKKWLVELGHEIVIFDPYLDPRLADKTLVVVGNMHALSLLEGIDRAIIASPPNEHYESAEFFLSRRVPILIEKPISLDLSVALEIRDLSLKYETPAYGVANMRFHDAYQNLKTYLKDKKILRWEGWFSHRLSQMRPNGLGEYAKQRSFSGGILLDCIHDLDLLMQFFPEQPEVFEYINNTGLENLNVEDSSNIIVIWNRLKASGCLNLDYLSPLKRRGIRVITSDEIVEWESVGKTPERSTVKASTNEYSKVIWQNECYSSELMFKTMIRKFLSGDSEGMQSIDEACRVLDIALNHELVDLSRGVF